MHVVYAISSKTRNYICIGMTSDLEARPLNSFNLGEWNLISIDEVIFREGQSLLMFFAIFNIDESLIKS